MADSPFVIECESCGNEYDIREEVAEDHDEDCLVYDDLVRQGKTREQHD